MKRDLVTNVFRHGKHSHKSTLAHYITDQDSDDMLLIKLEGELNYLNIETHSGLLSQVRKPQRIVLGVGYTCVMDNDAAEELDVVIQQFLS